MKVYFLIPLQLLFVLGYGKLLMTVWVLRHGAREPIVAYNEPLEKYGIPFQGYGTLNNIGMRQHYLLGRIFKELYKDEFDISAETVVVRSTTIDRTFMSGMSFISGLTSEAGEKELGQIKVPNVPFRTSKKALRLFNTTYNKLSQTMKYAVYRSMRKEDFISYSKTPGLCPGNLIALNKFHKSDVFNGVTKAIRQSLSSLLKRFYTDPLGDAYKKIETLRYAIFYNHIPSKLMTEQERIDLDKSFTRIMISKGLTATARTGCHNLYRQMLKLFDLALARDQVAESDFNELAPEFHRELATRDPAYRARYQFLRANPGIVSGLKAFVFQNHDDLLLMMLSTLSTMNKLDMNIPFASAITFELHKELGNYYVKILFNGKPINMELCDSTRCPLEDFVRTIRSKGMYKNDSTFNKKCKINPS